MFKNSMLFLLCIFNNTSAVDLYDWAIIGAGPAGISTLAVLLEFNVNPHGIIWIDPEFNVGRMGNYYRNVPSNTKNKQQRGYIESCAIFKKFPSLSRDLLFTLNREEFYPLSTLIDPLIDITKYLQSQVPILKDTVIALAYDDHEWNISSHSKSICAKKVILATGAHPKQLDYSLYTIPSDHALDKDKLATYVKNDDTIAVFGGMHSALLIVKYLTELGVNHIINFYTTPYFSRIPGAESLEGVTKEWVENVLEKNPPVNLLRISYTTENVEQLLPACNKVIYAIGYERDIPLINGTQEISFDEKTGIIAPNLYGIGIAFPKTITQRNGKKVAINGFNVFVNQARYFIPKWKEQ